MMKDNKGITLLILVVTIIVLIIITTIAINYGTSTIKETTEQKIESELSLLQTGIFQKYLLLKSKNKTGIIATPISSNMAEESDSLRPKELIGTRLSDTKQITNNGFQNPLKNYNAEDENLTYEEYYYYIGQDDLIKLGISKPDDSFNNDTDYKYIVNYSTGEVYDIENNHYYNNSVYLNGTDTKVKEDNYNFIDE